MEEALIATTQLQFSEKVKHYYPEILTDDALEFLIALHQKFNKGRLQLLQERNKRQLGIDLGIFPEFPKETEQTRNADWRIPYIPNDLLDRRVEITGPVDRKMVINALNSGANTFMADFEDSTAPSWENCMEGQVNLRDANLGTITHQDLKKGKTYQLNDEVAVLLVRPRGLHLTEKHLLINNEEASASLVDFGLYVYHNAKTRIYKGTAPYFYLPKIEHYLEARWWDEVFSFTEQYFNIANGTFKATVLIETITASFQLDEIIYELKNHIVGLNCGRWDYIFSFIKKFKSHPEFVLPDRDQISMSAPFMEAYSKLVIQRCHKRGIHAIGGMAAQIPVKDNIMAHKMALEKVRLDKEREAKNGHDGTWVAHPALVAVAKAQFDQYMPGPNQLDKTLEELQVSAADLIAVPKGTITEAGIRKNINVGLLYLESWLRGQGCVALYNLMEDTATAEISRAQIWQWRRFNAKLKDGRKFTHALYEQIFNEEVAKITHLVGEANMGHTQYKKAFELFDVLVQAREFSAFLTLKAYDEL